jgi:PAS domain-containing protein
MSVIHQKIVLKLGVALFDSKANNVIELGEMMLKAEADNIASGGFWIWDYAINEVYYSPKFCEVLGFSSGDFGNGFAGFDLGNKEQMAVGMGLINDLIANKSESVFVNPITFEKKDSSILNCICSGTVFYKNGQPKYILGTHKLN